MLAGRGRDGGSRGGTGDAVRPRFLGGGGRGCGVVLGTTLRAIGRGFGSGTFGLAAASAAHADNPRSARLVAKASARLVARAVDRNAAARADGVTAFLRGESFNR